jgi:Fur family transcriptional regulator, ferric uptake regulator
VTEPHTGPTVEAPRLEDALAAVRARGLRLSAARQLVLEALYEADAPLSADEVAARAGGPDGPSDSASVYRNLEKLEELGLVRHFHAGHGPGLYVRAGDAREYLLCDSCGTLTAVEPSALDEARASILRRHGFHARFTHMPAPGLCADCVEDGTA